MDDDDWNSPWADVDDIEDDTPPFTPRAVITRSIKNNNNDGDGDGDHKNNDFLGTVLAEIKEVPWVSEELGESTSAWVDDAACDDGERALTADISLANVNSDHIAGNNEKIDDDVCSTVKIWVDTDGSKDVNRTNLEPKIPAGSNQVDSGQGNSRPIRADNRDEKVTAGIDEDVTSQPVPNDTTSHGTTATGDDSDDFGDFADHGDYEESDCPIPLDIPKPAESSIPAFEIETSLISSLYPIPTSYPTPPPLENDSEIVYTIGARKAWYRLSQAGTLRRTNADEDAYVHITWAGSKVRDEIHAIVAKWGAEDKSSGIQSRGPMLRNHGNMFGWGQSSTSNPGQAKPISVKTNHTPPSVAPRTWPSADLTGRTPAVSLEAVADFGWGNSKRYQDDSIVEPASKIRNQTPLPSETERSKLKQDITADLFSQMTISEADCSVPIQSLEENSTPSTLFDEWGSFENQISSTQQSMSNEEVTDLTSTAGIALGNASGALTTVVVDHVPRPLTVDVSTNVHPGTPVSIPASPHISPFVGFDDFAETSPPLPIHKNHNAEVVPLSEVNKPSETHLGSDLPISNSPGLDSLSSLNLVGVHPLPADHNSTSELGHGSLNAPLGTAPLADNSIESDWDLSFFEKPPVKMQPAAEYTHSNDLWDTPPILLQGKKNDSDSDIVKGIVEGLPCLAYMLV